MKLYLLISCFLIMRSIGLELDVPTHAPHVPNPDYLSELKSELSKEWPNNRTINLVYHGHSVPAGYFKTPVVNTFDSYPFQVLKQLKEHYPNAVVNAIITSKGGENSQSGRNRFEKEVLNHNPDVIFIDYGLNDRGIGLEESKKAWKEMIEMAMERGIKVILVTPSPDLRSDLQNPEDALQKHAEQIVELASTYSVGLADVYTLFRQLDRECACIEDYMSQVNHPNKTGHAVIAQEILKYFLD